MLVLVQSSLEAVMARQLGLSGKQIYSELLVFGNEDMISNMSYVDPIADIDYICTYNQVKVLTDCE